MDHFINEQLLIDEPFTFGRTNRNSRRRTIGKLGNGILRPKYRTVGGNSKQDSIPSTTQHLFKMTDQDTTEKISQQIATSIQNRIDKAALENQEQKATIEPSSKKSKVITTVVIVGGIIAAGILIYVFKKSTPKNLKTVKL